MNTTTHTLDQLGKLEALRSLRSQLCPACCGSKQAMKSLCGPCYYRLPRDKAKALYVRIGEGYEANLIRALRFLGCDELTMPAQPPAKERK